MEFKIKDVVGSLANGNSGNDGDVVAPGKGAGKGKSGEKGSGKPGGQGGAVDLKALTLWLSTNGKDWTKVSSDLVSLSPDKITARLNSKPKDDATGIFEAFNRDVTGEPGQTYYLGVSTSTNSYSGDGAMSARVVSWTLLSKNSATSGATAVPEPLLWPLFGAAALGLGYAFRPRRKD